MAYTDPTLPTLPDINPAVSALRTIGPLANGAALTAYLGNTDGNGGPQFGDDVILTAGVTYSAAGFTLPVPTGTVGTEASGANYVTIRSSAMSSLPAGTRVTSSSVANMPTLTTSDGLAGTKIFAPAANTIHHYRFIGLNFVCPAVLTFQTGVYLGPVTNADKYVAGNYAHHLSFERCRVIGHMDYGVQKALYLLGNDLKIIDCEIDNAMTPNQGESNCILVTYSSHRVLIHNNATSGMGENIFIGPDAFGGVGDPAGFEYVIPQHVTITRNYIFRKLQWLLTHATYQPPCSTDGTGTVSSSGTTLTFSTSQSGLTGKFIRGATSGNLAKVTSGSGTSWVVTWITGASFTGSESWRYNTVDWTAKNLLEFKACAISKVDSNVFENGWKDGQQYAIAITPRSFGWVSDFTFTNNQLNHCTGINISIGDYSTGNAFGPAPHVTKRVNVSNNLWKNIGSTIAHAISYTFPGMALKVCSDNAYGGFASFGGNMIASAETVGASRTFTSSIGAELFLTGFDSQYVGLDLAYGTGRATITSINSTSQCTATITVAFDAAVTGTGTILSSWYMGPSALVKTAMAAGDSWKFEHNTFVGPDIVYDPINNFDMRYMPSLGNDDQNGITANTSPLTNFIWRDNMMYLGSLGGLRWEDHGQGHFALDTSGFMDAATLDWSRNVYFGPAPANILVYDTAIVQYGYGASFAGGVKTAFHIPDETGSTNGGSVGFTDYDNEDFTLTGTYATAAHDGTMIGCNYSSVNTTWTNVVAGVADGEAAGFRYLPIRWP